MRISRSLVLVLGIVASTVVVAQQREPRVAAYDSLKVKRPTPNEVTFTKQAAEVGDRVEQQLMVQLDLDSTVRQGDKEIDKSNTSLLREQDRTVIAEEVVEGRTVAARVRFAKYALTVNDKSDHSPVVGKTFLCRRLEDDSLSVTREDGSFASPDEFAAISESMQALGKPNPLADFLAGQTVAIGQTIEVPQEIGAMLLGSNDSLGTVEKFSLTLREVEAKGNVARFDVDMETQGSKKTQMRLIVNGDLDVEINSCRTQRMAISGPLGMATTMGSYSTAQTTFVRGKLKLEMSASYN